MFVGILAFLTAIALAGVAAWFSITGLMAIFAALPMSVAIMAGVLEVGKLVTASLVYRNWTTLSRSLRAYLVSAIVVLMLITSLGIFGYLSKAHLDQNAPVSNNIAKIERLEQRIKREQRAIDDAETLIEQLDATIATLIEYDKISGPDGARAVRENQQPQRIELNNIIDQSQERIDEYLDEKFQYEQTVRDFETEVGPIKYIAALAYDNPEEHYDTAVRAIILLLIFVFDPLAVLLLIAANKVQMDYAARREQEQLEEDDIADIDEVEDIFDQMESELKTEDVELGDDFMDAFDTEPLEIVEEDLGEIEEAFHNAEVIDPPPMPENEEWKEHEIATKPEQIQEPEEDEEPTKQRVVAAAGISEYTSPSELKLQPMPVLIDILEQIDDREKIRPLSRQEQDRRQMIVRIIRERHSGLSNS